MYALCDEWGFIILEGTLAEIFYKYKKMLHQGVKGMEIYRENKRIFKDE